MTRRRYPSVTDEQYGQLWRRLEEVARRVREGTLDFQRVMWQLQREVIEVKKMPDTYEAEVNYDLRLAAAIKANNYSWVNPDITEKHFPATRSGLVKLNFVLCHPNRVISSDEVKKEMEKQDLRPAELPELLAFGAKYPDIQRRFPVVALGSVWQGWSGGRSVPCLDRDGSERHLYLLCFGVGWASCYRFLAVSK